MKEGNIKRIGIFLVVALLLMVVISAKDFEIKNDTNNFLFVNGTTGYVGVGTASPDAILDVAGSSLTDVVDVTGEKIFTISRPSVGIYSPRATFGIGRWADVTNRAKTSLTLSLLDETASHTDTDTDVMTWQSGGNVGIGTISPDQPLTVQGNINTSGSLHLGDSAVKLFRSGDSAVLRGNSSVVLQNGTTNIFVVTDGVVYGSSSNPDLGWANSNRFGTVYAETAHFNGTADNYFNGDVGIGTTTPGAILDVNGNSSDGILRVQGDSSVNYLGLGADGTYGTINAINTGAGNTGLQFKTSQTGTETPRMTILSSGEVGIGTTSISHLLQLNGSAGNFTVSETDSSNKAVMIGAGTNDGIIDVFVSGSIRDTHLEGFGDSWINANNGLLGVGTDEPTEPLHVFENSSGGTANLVLEQAGTGDTALRFLLTGVTTWIMGADNSDSNSFKIGKSSGLNGVTDFVIDTSGNVGIGTSSPDRLLDVSGDVRTQSEGTSNDAFQILSSDAQSLMELNEGSDTRALLKLRNGGNTESIRLDTGADSWLNGGSLGIGTTTPDTDLHIVDGSTPTIKIQETGSGDPNLLLNTTDTEWSLRIDNSDNDNFEIRNTDEGTSYTPFTIEETAPNNAFFIESTGNVGIGTTTPDRLLEVEEFDFYNGATLRLTNSYGSSDWNSNNTIGAIEFYGSDASDPTIYSTIRARVMDDGSYTSPYNVGLDFFTTKAGTPSQAMIIDDDGYVGIGTPNPTTLLHLNKSNADTIMKVERSADNDAGIGYCNTQDCAYAGLGSTEDWVISDQGDLSGNPLFAVDLATGNVGIGTSSPETELHIVTTDATAKNLLTLQNDQAWGGIQDDLQNIVWKDSGAVVGAVGMVYDGTTTNMHFGSMYNSGYTTDSLMVIKGDGNVGIGTTAPESLLTVNGNVSLNNTLYTSGANVGIGTSSPGAILDIKDGTGSGRIFLDSAGNSYITSDRAGASSRNVFVVSTAGDSSQTIPDNVDWAFGSADSDDVGDGSGFYIGTSTQATSAKLFINSSGSVGIGTTSPDELLEVAGTIKSTGLTPIIEFEDTSSSPQGDMRFKLDNNDMFLEGDEGADGTFEESVALALDGTAGLIVKADLELNDLAPVLRFEDTSASAYDYRFVGNSNLFELDVDTNDDGTSDVDNILTANSLGYVGIGVNSATYPLTIDQVSKDVDSTLNIISRRNADNYNHAVIYMGAPRNTSADGTGVNGRAMMSLVGDGTTNTANFFISTQSASLSPTQNGSELQGVQHSVQFSSGGFVDFWKAGTNYAQLSGVGDSFVLGEFGVADTTPDYQFEIGATSSNGYFGIADGSIFEVDSTGKVGIGTATPAQTLNVIGDINATGTICDSNGENCIGSGSGSTSWKFSSGLIYNATTGVNVGIGTASPTQQLTLTKNISIADDKSTCYGATDCTDGMIYWDSTDNKLVIKVT